MVPSNLHSLDSLFPQQSNSGKSYPAVTSITGIRSSAAALTAVQIIKTLQRPALCIVPSEPQAQVLSQDLNLFSELPVFHYPAHEIPPYTPLSPDPQTVSNRISALYQVITTNQPFVMIASAESLLRRIVPKQTITRLAELVITGEETDPAELTTSLIEAGYEQMSLVQNAGEFSIRGGIFDIFPTGSELPIRLDFFGDTIESIRSFDPLTQRSVQEIEECEIIPANDILFPKLLAEKKELLARIEYFSNSMHWNKDEQEVLTEKISQNIQFPGIEFFLPLFSEKLVSPLSYLPDNSKVFIFEPLEVKKSISLTWERIEANYSESQKVQTIALPPDSLFVNKNEFYQELESYFPIIFNEFQETKLDAIGSTPLKNSEEIDLHPAVSLKNKELSRHTISIKSTNHKLIKQNIELQRRKDGLLRPLSAYLTQWLDQGDHIHFACRSSKHAANIAEMLGNYHLTSRIFDSVITELRPSENHISIYCRPLSEGFDLPEEKLHFLSETELFGDKRIAPRQKKRQANESPTISFEELNNGDIVVHSDNGLGIYRGIITLTLSGLTNDFLQINYKGNDKLYVPIDRINSVTKYNGLSDRKPAISRLGSKTWINTKKKVKKAVWDVAQNLLTLYARRKLEKGRVFKAPDSMYHELEESFPYDETPGQMKAINEVIDDLTSERPMDRLVCGDVGFGKTEVAIRAAFKVAVDGKQVAILVPTTVLAEQHAQTFNDRLASFPVRIECLNRFKSASEQKTIVKDINNGRVDIIIGTHRILSKDIDFSNLGLLIIDEEHRFGVSHKEKLKIIKSKVEVLTLTATPIPRTLQMSLLGVRDLSVISSPPRHRQSIKTFVAKYDDLVIKEAVIRELQRGGQVFLIHNRVNSIHEVAAKVQKMVPEARVAVAHGQMPGKILEEIMVSFVTKQVNVLICTTIVESGLDIPNANTIIINRADRLGLADIYQLRGRVGRSSEQAYAYLLVPSLEDLSKDAKQRLRALMEYNELGGGFKLALSDLQIRGGGNILGESQSGTIAAIGYDLYLDLLQRTVDDLKRRGHQGLPLSEDDCPEPEINLTVSAFLANSYIPDPDQRYIAYKRITSVTDKGSLLDMRDEFIDRYGKLPDEGENLFAIIGLKELLKRLKITKLEQGPNALVFSFHQSTPITPAQILHYIKKAKGKARMTPDSKLVVKHNLSKPMKIFAEIENILRAIKA